MSKRQRGLFDSLGTSDGVRVNWRMMWHVVNFVRYFEEVVRFHEAGRPGAPCWVLLHTLKSIDEHYLVRTLFWYIYFFLPRPFKVVLIPIFAIMFLQQKIPSIVVPQGLPLSGDLTLVWHPNIVLRGSYAISKDGVSVSGWNTLLKMNTFLEVEDKLLLFLHIGSSELFLFGFYIPTMPAEKDMDVPRQLLM